MRRRDSHRHGVLAAASRSRHRRPHRVGTRPMMRTTRVRHRLLHHPVADSHGRRPGLHRRPLREAILARPDARDPVGGQGVRTTTLLASRRRRMILKVSGACRMPATSPHGGETSSRSPPRLQAGAKRPQHGSSRQGSGGQSQRTSSTFPPSGDRLTPSWPQPLKLWSKGT